MNYWQLKGKIQEELHNKEFPNSANIMGWVKQYVESHFAAKDMEIGELKEEINRLREGLEEILRSREYEGFMLVSPAFVENLLENPDAGENPTVVDKNNS